MCDYSTTKTGQVILYFDIVSEIITFGDKGRFGIAIMKKYRGKGIGTEAIKQQLNIYKQKDRKISFL